MQAALLANFWSQDALDPLGILSPGKQGIWPAKFRHNREYAVRDSGGTNVMDGHMPDKVMNGIQAMKLPAEEKSVNQL